MIYLFTLPGCPHSEAALQLVQDLNLPHEDKKVADEEKKKYKKKHGMKTFPQIFFKNSKGEMVKLGGFKEFKSIMELCQSR